MYLLDTCVISELSRVKPEPSVVRFITEQPETELLISALTVGELKNGIVRLPKSKKKDALEEWFEKDLLRRFGSRILPVDFEVASIWGELAARAELVGKRLPVVDGLIAATALSHRSALVTRNVKDFASCKVDIINPWSDT